MFFFLKKATSIYLFLPVTGSKIKIDECTLLGIPRMHLGTHNKS